MKIIYKLSLQKAVIFFFVVVLIILLVLTILLEIINKRTNPRIQRYRTKYQIKFFNKFKSIL